MGRLGEWGCISRLITSPLLTGVMCGGHAVVMSPLCGMPLLVWGVFQVPEPDERTHVNNKHQPHILDKTTT